MHDLFTPDFIYHPQYSLEDRDEQYRCELDNFSKHDGPLVSKTYPLNISSSDKDIMTWIYNIYDDAGKDIEQVNLPLFQGCTLETLKNKDIDFYLKVDNIDGRWLRDKIEEALIPIFSPNIPFCDEIHLQVLHKYIEDKPGETVITKRQRGRPKKQTDQVKKKPKHKTEKLWKFIRNLLHDPKYCPEVVCWENHDEGTFRFKSSDKVAKLWGDARGNQQMNYEKLSRAMRYYYKSDIFQPVLGKRLVYKFGDKANEWRSLNPNFDNKNI